MLGQTLCQQTVHASVMPTLQQITTATLEADRQHISGELLQLWINGVDHMDVIREHAHRDDDRDRLELGVFKPQRLFEDVLYLIGCERTSNLH